MAWRPTVRAQRNPACAYAAATQVGRVTDVSSDQVPLIHGYVHLAGWFLPRALLRLGAVLALIARETVRSRIAAGLEL